MARQTYIFRHAVFFFLETGEPCFPGQQLFRISILLNTPWTHECHTLNLNHKGGWRGPDTRGKGNTVTQGSSCILPCQAAVLGAKWSGGTRNELPSYLPSSFQLFALRSLLPLYSSSLFPFPKPLNLHRKRENVCRKGWEKRGKQQKIQRKCSLWKQGSEKNMKEKTNNMCGR